MFGSGMLKSHGVVFSMLFAPLLTTLKDTYGNVAEAMSGIANRTMRMDIGGTSRIESVPTDTHSANGLRVVENLWKATEDLTTTGWFEFLGAVIDSPTQVTFTSKADQGIYQYSIMPSATYRTQCVASVTSGTKNVRFRSYTATDGEQFSVDILLTTTPQVITANITVTQPQPASTVIALWNGSDATSGVVTVTKFSFVDVTGLPASYVPEYVPRDTPVGANLVTNGTFDTDTDWTKGLGVTISGGKAVCIGAGSTALRQTSVQYTSGIKYLLTFEVSNYSSGFIRPAFNGSATTGWVTSNGVHTVITTSTGGILWMMGSGFTGSIDNVSVHEASTGRKVFDTASGNTVLNNIVTEGVGGPLFPTTTLNGTTINKSLAKYVTATVVAAGGQMFDAGRYYTSALGGATNGATLLTDIGVTDWVDDGFYQPDYGVLVEGAATNLYPIPTAVVTQTVTLAVGNHTLTVYGTGSITTANGTGVATGHGTATEGAPVILNITTAGTVVFTLTGALDKAQLETGIVWSSFTPSTRSDSMGTIKWNSSFFNHPLGNVFVTWCPQFASSSGLNIVNQVLLTFDGGGTFPLRQATMQVMQAFDGANVTTINTGAFDRGDAIQLNLRFGLDADSAQAGLVRMQFSLRNATQGSPWVHAASVPYDGAFADTGFLQLLKALGGNNSILQQLPVVWDKPLANAELDSIV